jgi:hypothetical protein
MALSESKKAYSLFPRNPSISDLMISSYLANEMYIEAYDLVNKLHHHNKNHPINFDRLSRIYRFALDIRCEEIIDSNISNDMKIDRVSQELINHFHLINNIFKQRNIKLIFVIGNCQTWPLMRMLNSQTSFTEKYVVVCYKTIHTMSKIEQLAVSNILNIFDIIITQNITNTSKYFPLSTEKLRSKYKNILTVPTCWFNGYFPDAFSAGDLPCADFHFGLHSASVFRSFFDNRSQQDALGEFESLKIETKKARKILEINFEEIEYRDKNLDVRINNTIKENYQSYLMFYNFNHCSVHLLGYIANKICENLSIPPLDVDNITKYEALDHIIWKISNEVKNCLGLNFDSNPFILNKEKISCSSFINQAYTYYKSLDENVIYLIGEALDTHVVKYS